MAGKVHKKRVRKSEKERTAKFYDYNLVFLVIFLTVIGAIMVFSATGYTSSGDEFKKQVIFAIIGVVIMIGVSFFPYGWYKHIAVIGIVLSVILIILVKSPIGYASHGAARWIRIGGTVTERADGSTYLAGGLSVQVAEPVKIAVIIYSALIISRIGKQVSNKKGILMLFSVSGVLAVMLLGITNNLSSALIVLGIVFCMWFIAHPKYKMFAAIAGGAVAVAVIAIMIAEVSGGSGGGFRIERIAAWLHPEEYAGDTSYQTLQALYAIGSGGLFGKGLGSSSQKLIMPEVQNDMIFAIICEELGLFGAMVVILLYILLLYRIFYIARNVKDSFAAMLATGVFAHIALQVVINIAVVTNSIPNTGVSLPFISAGGSSLVFLMIEMGMVLNVSRSIPYE